MSIWIDLETYIFEREKCRDQSRPATTDPIKFLINTSSIRRWRIRPRAGRRAA